MNTNRKFLPLIMIGALLVVACEKAPEQEAQTTGQKLSGMVEKTEKDVSSVKKAAEKDLQKSGNMMEEAGKEVAAAKDATMSKLKELIEKAKKLLAENKFEEAISSAQSALALDGNSQEAKDIIAQAKEKMAQKLNEVKDGVTDKFKSFGQ